MITKINEQETVVKQEPKKPVRKNIGTYLLEAGVIDQEKLDEAVELAQKFGIRVGRSLVLLQYITEAELMFHLAQQHNLSYTDLDAGMVDHKTARLISAKDARSLGALPLESKDGTVKVAIVDPGDNAVLDEITTRLNKKVVPTVITQQAFEEALETLYHEDYTHRSTQELKLNNPENSAARVLSKGQKIFFIVVLILSGLWIIVNAVSFSIFFAAMASAFFLASSLYRFYLIYRALSHDLEVPVSQEEIEALDDRELPIFTILIPLYKEANVLPKLTGAISNLDYPKFKLDIKLLLEANDAETIEAARALNLPPNFEHVIVPHSFPKTKPKACNYGLIKARGEFVVIYDAEDLPDSDQLKKVVVAFRKVNDNVACIQAKLNYFNRNQNLLTRWFTLEYSMWFDLFLPGLDASGAPVPLGGTSNHFRRVKLEELGGWDPFNVTEDADLGVRMHKAGYKTVLVDSTTFEEANSDVGNWIRQRSRWVKGYIQTWLVHSRHPFRLWRALGNRAFFGFQLTVGGTFFGLLLNPISWVITIMWFLTHWGLIQQIFAPPVYYFSLINFLVGNFAFIYMSMAGALRRRYYDMVKYALLIPGYWLLMTIGAWKGMLQLIYKPFFWEKTIHGLDKGAAHKVEARPALAAQEVEAA